MQLDVSINVSFGLNFLGVIYNHDNPKKKYHIFFSSVLFLILRIWNHFVSIHQNDSNRNNMFLFIILWIWNWVCKAATDVWSCAVPTSKVLRSCGREMGSPIFGVLPPCKAWDVTFGKTNKSIFFSLCFWFGNFWRLKKGSEVFQCFSAGFISFIPWISRHVRGVSRKSAAEARAKATKTKIPN